MKARSKKKKGRREGRTKKNHGKKKEWRESDHEVENKGQQRPRRRGGDDLVEKNGLKGISVIAERAGGKLWDPVVGGARMRANFILGRLYRKAGGYRGAACLRIPGRSQPCRGGVRRSRARRGCQISWGMAQGKGLKKKFGGEKESRPRRGKRNGRCWGRRHAQSEDPHRKGERFTTLGLGGAGK